MEIILDALEYLHGTMKTRELFGLEDDRWVYSKEDVDGLFQSLDNSFVETE